MKKNLITFLSLLTLVGILFIGGKGVWASFVQPTVGPTGGNLPAPIDTGSTSQEKVGGKLGLKGANPTGTPFDFILDGSALFAGGVRAGSAFFEGNVIVGDVVPSGVQVYGDVRLFGNGTMTNTALAHTSPQPRTVCSTSTGQLALCGTGTVDLVATPSSIQFTGPTTLTWTTSNMASCVASSTPSGWSGTKPVTNTTGESRTVTTTTNFTLTCTSIAGDIVSDSATVTVSGTCVPITQAPTLCEFYDDPGPASPDNAVCINGVQNINGQTVRHYEVQALNAPNTASTWTTVFTNTFGPSTDMTPTTNLNYGWSGTPVEKEGYAPFRIRAFDTQVCVSPWSVSFPSQGSNSI